MTNTESSGIPGAVVWEYLVGADRRAEYEGLDERCAALTLRETRVGVFREVIG